MPKHVCQIAYDSGLLATRELLLKDAGYVVSSFLGNHAAIQGIKSGCDLFVVGYAAGVAVRNQMVRWLKTNFPSSPVIALYPSASSVQQVELADHHSFYENPAEWLAAIAQAGAGPESKVEIVKQKSAPRSRPAHQLLSTRYDVVVVGSSAGGLRALSELLSPMGADFPAAIAVVQHLSPEHKSVLSALLSRLTRLKVREAISGIALRPGTVYVAPPDRHLLVEQGHLKLTRTPAVRYSRPSVDLLFKSAAESYGPRCLAVVLSGSGSDGAAGVRAVHQAGGTCVAQDPGSAEHGPMPQAAIATGCVDHVSTLDKLGAVVENLCWGRPLA